MSQFLMVCAAIVTICGVLAFVSARRWVRWAIRATEYGIDQIQNTQISPTDRKDRYDRWHAIIANISTTYCFETDAASIRRLGNTKPRGFGGVNQLDANVKEWTAEMCARLFDLARRVERGRTFLRHWWWVPRQPDL
jgi:hypothetical protein